ncbi:MAG: DJ-1 family glyoxalase III [Acutalibacteraceae bacterium]|nr:DJ-1 family glyoxalase III [Acutalibacteraceae bacterium]
MVYVFLADGFEEIEALATVDFLRRCDIEVVTAGVGSQDVTGAHDITVLADTVDSMLVKSDDVEAIVLPGGMPGTLNLQKSQCVQEMLDFAVQQRIAIAAICAAPSVLGQKGLLDGKKATCFPGFEQQLGKAEFTGASVEVDGNIITSKGAGCTIDFASAIATKLIGESKPLHVKKSMQCQI